MSGNGLLVATTHTHVSTQITDFAEALEANETIAANTAYRLAGRRNNFEASAAPDQSDDATQGYAVGSVWIVPSLALTYTCVDASAGAAQWLQTNLSIDMFSACDTVGGLYLNNGYVPIKWNKVNYADSFVFEHVDGSSDILIGGSEPMLLSISAEVSTFNTDSNRSGCVMRLMSDTGRGFVEVRGSRAYQYNRTSASSRNTAGCTVGLAVQPGNRLRVEASIDTGKGDLYTQANASRIQILKLKTL